MEPPASFLFPMAAGSKINKVNKIICIHCDLKAWRHIVFQRYDFLALLQATLKGLPDSIFEKVYARIHFNKGAKELVDELHSRGFKVGLVSGGFHETVDRLAKEAGIDYVKANHLEVIDGFLTGKVYGEIVTKDVKVAKLKDWAAENGLKLSQTIAMGDGANDLPMIKTAGIGIAFCAKPIVRAQAPYQITEPDLYKVIEILDEVGK